MTETVVHIDGDIIAYSCAAVAHKKVYNVVDKTILGGGSITLSIHSTKKAAESFVKTMENISPPVPRSLSIEEDYILKPVGNAIQAAKLLLEKIESRTEADASIIFLSGETNYRDRVATLKPYKGNRISEKPIHYEAVYNYLLENHICIIADDMEADDCLGIFQRENTICATIDKDLDMVEGQHYNWRKDELYYVHPEDAKYNFYIQLLMGDRVDNIDGIPGVGIKTAEKILHPTNLNVVFKGDKKEEQMYWATLCEYSKHYEKPMEALIETARLLWIRRKRNEMWNPPV